jgi:biotin-dependent carboxylase-like uncharacterized protein
VNANHDALGDRMIEVLATGPQLTVQDLGRVGYAAWGVARGGAADRESLRRANRLVGNAESAAALELLLGGVQLRFDAPAVIALTGAAGELLVDDRPGHIDGPQSIRAGAEVRIAPAPNRLRGYLAVGGGLATPVLLGSRSTDEASGIGRALRTGDRVPFGTGPAGPVLADLAPPAGWPRAPIELRARLGPRDDWVSLESLGRFTDATYIVDGASDRVGVRLAGPALERTRLEELRSEPALRGAIEVPGDGQPIVFGADCPTTCGYPVIAVLEPASADLIAQCRPGQAVRFTLARPTLRLRERPIIPSTSGAGRP